MPRDSARSSSSVSRARPAASPSVARARLRVALELPLGPGEVHVQPDQLLLRPVVDVALQPAQRDGLGGDGGVAALGQPAELGLGGRAGGEHAPGPLGLQERDAADGERQQDGDDQPDEGVEQDPASGRSSARSRPAPAGPGCPGRSRRRAAPSPRRRSVRPPRATDQKVTVTTKEKIASGNRTTACSASSHVCGSRSGVSSRRIRLPSGRAGRRDGGAGGRERPGSQARSTVAKPAGGEQGRGQDGDAHPDHQQPDAQAEAGDDDDEGGDRDREAQRAT